jgi:sulfate transport system permease protein
VPKTAAAPGQATRTNRSSRLALRFVALGYLALLLVLPVWLVAWRTFAGGVGPVWDALSSEPTLHAFRVTAVVALCTVVANTVFGVGTALLLVRHDFPGKRVLNALIDLPLAVSPVVVGLALILIYGRFEPVGGWLADHGVQMIFALPGMVMATVFISLPLVVREVVPVLEEIGIEQEQAARSLGANAIQTFRRVTLPSIRWALVYGVVLSLARSLGEFGAVKIVGGNLIGKTQTATLVVEQKYQDFEQSTAYAAAFLLASASVLCILIVALIRPKEPT